MGVEETDDALLPPPKVGKAVSSLAPCHLKIKNYFEKLRHRLHAAQTDNRF